MTEAIGHECGIALIRLRKPIGYFIEKYGTPAYAVNKLFLLMEKQHNRGQDGAGVASIKQNLKFGLQYIDRLRSVAKAPIVDIFEQIGNEYNRLSTQPEFKSAKWAKENLPFCGEILIGHLRYATYGKNDIRFCHPVMRQNNWRSRTLLMAGNFNMTNNDDIFNELVSLGQHPKERADTVTVLEKFGHFLDRENQMLWEKFDDKKRTPREIIELIEDEIDLCRVVTNACTDFDGGYAMMGLTGHGAAFVARDPAGIRPAYYYQNDEIIVAASEKSAIKTAFNAEYDEIYELPPANALLIDRNGNYSVKNFTQAVEKKSCSFERIYFSRGTDPQIYSERKSLGRNLTSLVLQAVEGDLPHTVFSYIPNTAETAFLGLLKGIEAHLIDKRIEALKGEGKLSYEEIEKIIRFRPRVEKLVIKDTKLRTFITGDEQRDEFVAHVYDTTYEVLKKGEENIVVIDDSIVRGTTLEKSIIKMLDKLCPKKIVVVSSAPQIRYPDCYGIDMSKMSEFVAFRAVLELLKENKMSYLLEEVYHKCLASLNLPAEKVVNYVKELYAPFSYEQVSQKVGQIVRASDVNAEITIVYQTVEGLHDAVPGHRGDWYFTGDYPTPGGAKVANRAFIYFMENKKERAY
jgi:amidophosphoribosyltransferase